MPRRGKSLMRVCSRSREGGCHALVRVLTVNVANVCASCYCLEGACASFYLPHLRFVYTSFCCREGAGVFASCAGVVTRCFGSDSCYAVDRCKRLRLELVRVLASSLTTVANVFSPSHIICASFTHPFAALRAQVCLPLFKGRQRVLFTRCAPRPSVVTVGYRLTLQTVFYLLQLHLPFLTHPRLNGAGVLGETVVARCARSWQNRLHGVLLFFWSGTKRERRSERVRVSATSVLHAALKLVCAPLVGSVLCKTLSEKSFSQGRRTLAQNCRLIVAIIPSCESREVSVSVAMLRNLAGCEGG